MSQEANIHFFQPATLSTWSWNCWKQLKLWRENLFKAFLREGKCIPKWKHMEEEQRDSKREEWLFVNNIKTHYYKTTHVTLHNGADKFHKTHVSTLPRDVSRRYRFNRLTEYFCLVVFVSYISIDLVFLQGRWKLLVFWWSGRGRSRHAGFHSGIWTETRSYFQHRLGNALDTKCVGRTFMSWEQKAQLLKIYDSFSIYKNAFCIFFST